MLAPSRPLRPLYAVLPDLAAAGNSSRVRPRRPNVSTACQVCRKARQKCNGGRPCSRCARSGHDCHYEADHRSKTYRQTLLSEANKKGADLEKLLEALLSSSESEAMEIVRSLRSSRNVTTIEKSVESVVTPPEEIPKERMEDENTSMPSGELAFAHPLFGLLQPFDLAPNRLEVRENEVVCWTTVTQDPEVIDHLLTLYFTYHHPICPVIPESLIRMDMANRKTTYCSPTLLNAMLAVGCSFLGFSSETNGSGKHWPTGEAFSNEAERLLAAHPKPELTGVAALCLLAMLENLQLRYQSSCGFSGRASCMALFLGLHMEIAGDKKSTVVEDHESTLAYVRQQLFWVCFQVDQIASMNAGCQPQIVLDEADARYTTLDDTADAQTLLSPSQTPPEFYLDGNRNDCMLSLIGLARIVNTTLLESRSPFFGKGKFDIEHWESRYRTWYTNLPPTLTVHDGSPTHIIAMHMWFHGSLIQSFRLVFARGSQEAAIAHRVCREAAETITDLLLRHRELHGLRGFNAVLCRSLLDAYTIHLHHVQSNLLHLRAIIDAYQELSKHQEWAKAWLQRLEYQTRHSTGAAAGTVEALFERKTTSTHVDTIQGPLPTETIAKTQNLVDQEIGEKGNGIQRNGFAITSSRLIRRRPEYFFSPFARH